MSSPTRPRSERVVDPEITDIQKEFGASRSKRQRYADLVIGEPGWWPLIRYELVMLLSSWVPGALGLFLRSKLYPLILGRVGRNVAFGQRRFTHRSTTRSSAWSSASWPARARQRCRIS